MRQSQTFPSRPVWPARITWRLLRLALLALALALLAGCASTRGAPTSFLDHERAPHTNEAMAGLMTADTEAERNVRLAEAMSDVDVFYIKYRDELLRSDNVFNASVDLATLAAGVAGGLTNSLGVKDNYLALGALLNGTRATVNNRFLYAQTGMALIKGMDAARASTALAIKEKQQARYSIDQYTGRDAYADVLKYYFDGTLAGGLIWLQSQAEKQEADTKVAIAKLTVPTPEQYKTRSDFHRDVRAALVAASEQTLRAVLNDWEVKNSEEKNVDNLRLMLQAELNRRMQDGQSLETLRSQLVAKKLLGDTP